MDTKRTFSAADVLAMAEQMETKGAEFYRQAAEKSSDPQLRDLLLNLAMQEDQHREYYASLREKLLESKVTMAPTAEDGGDVTSEYLKSYQNKEVSGLNQESLSSALEKGRPVDIIKLASEMENQSIAFYSGFVGMIGDESERNLVKKIIKDEMGHVVQLNNLLRMLSPA